MSSVKTLFSRGLAVAVALLLALGGPIGHSLSQSDQMLYLPMTVRHWPPVIYDSPALQPISNTDLDNNYPVMWAPVDDAEGYTLQESATADFSGPIATAQVNGLIWSSLNRTPGTYYYRVAGHNQYGTGPYSAVQSVTIFPLFVGLQVRWDGSEAIRTATVADQGIHRYFLFDLNTDVDIIRMTGRVWYDPNPIGWTEENWSSYFQASTGVFKSSNAPGGDSEWKFGLPWKITYWTSFPEGVGYTDGQEFSVTGPHDGVTAFGVAYRYWEMTNRYRILVWQSGDWSTYAEPGDVVMRFDAGTSHLLTYSSLMQRYFKLGNSSPSTRQEVMQLTAATFFNGYTGSVSLSSVQPLAQSMTTPGADDVPNPGSVPFGGEMVLP